MIGGHCVNKKTHCGWLGDFVWTECIEIRKLTVGDWKTVCELSALKEGNSLWVIQGHCVNKETHCGWLGDFVLTECIEIRKLTVGDWFIDQYFNPSCLYNPSHLYNQFCPYNPSSLYYHDNNTNNIQYYIIIPNVHL